MRQSCLAWVSVCTCSPSPVTHTVFHTVPRHGPSLATHYSWCAFGSDHKTLSLSLSNTHTHTLPLPLSSLALPPSTSNPPLSTHHIRNAFHQACLSLSRTIHSTGFLRSSVLTNTLSVEDCVIAAVVSHGHLFPSRVPAECFSICELRYGLNMIVCFDETLDSFQGRLVLNVAFGGHVQISMERV